jgi:CheY-like chemotaxis protein
MNAFSSHPVTIVIVDPNSSDYDAMLTSAEIANSSVHFLSTGQEALRLSRRWKVDLWVVNITLRDMSGFDLAQKLRRGCRGVRVFMVGNEYQVEDELQTLTLGLTKYLCKPLEASWICCWAQPQIVVALADDDDSASRLDDGDIRPMMALLPGEAEFDRSPLVAVGSQEMPVILPFVAQPQRRPAA